MGCSTRIRGLLTGGYKSKMNYELYEVWGVDESGHEELIETTASKKEADALAKTSLDSYIETVIYKENENGDLDEVDRFEQG